MSCMEIVRIGKNDCEILIERIVESATKCQLSMEESIEIIRVMKKQDPLQGKRYGKGDRRKNKKNFNQHFRK